MDQTADSHYAVLGVQRVASAAEIRRAYRRALVAAHPDKGGARERFERLQSAYAVLSDRAERIIYDEKLNRGLAAGQDGSSCAEVVQTAAGAQVQRAATGVTAVVHGQTQGAAQRPVQPLQPPRCRQQATPCDSQLAAATATIQALLALGTSQPGSTAALSLGEAYASRAQLRRAAGQLHHAMFDAEEALRLHPGLDAAAALLRELAAAIDAAEASGAGGHADSDSSRSSGSDDEFCGF